MDRIVAPAPHPTNPKQPQNLLHRVLDRDGIASVGEYINKNEVGTIRCSFYWCSYSACSPMCQGGRVHKQERGRYYLSVPATGAAVLLSDPCARVGEYINKREVHTLLLLALLFCLLFHGLCMKLYSET